MGCCVSASLLEAAHEGAPVLVRAALAGGAEVDAAGPRGCTPLVAAARKGHAVIVGLLVEAGADVNKAMPSGSTPLMLAARHGHHRVVEILLAAGADVDAATPGGLTALVLAAEHGHGKVVEMLLDAGATAKTLAESAESALGLAVLHNKLPTDTCVRLAICSSPKDVERAATSRALKPEWREVLAFVKDAGSVGRRLGEHPEVAHLAAAFFEHRLFRLADAQDLSDSELRQLGVVEAAQQEQLRRVLRPPVASVVGGAS